MDLEKKNLITFVLDFGVSVMITVNPEVYLLNKSTVENVEVGKH